MLGFLLHILPLLPTRPTPLSLILNESPTFKEAFDFWFLTEIFSVIGEHNML